MTITDVTFERIELELKEPYTIAYETVAHATNFILKLDTDAGIRGWGCAAPDHVVTNESPAEVEQALAQIIAPRLRGVEVFHCVRHLTSLKQALGKSSSALAMVDIALHDLMARKTGVPLWQFLGGYRDSIPTSVTIGIMNVEETLEHARKWTDQGFTILKLKGGQDVEQDIARVRKVVERFPEITLRFDGNQGYDSDDAIRFHEETLEAGIEIFEQPTRIDDEAQLGTVTGQVGLPVMADESLKSLKDAFRLARNERIDMVNIKLMKVGGILEGLHINSVAKAANLEVMVGCLDECALAISAGLHFALSRPNIEYADLDGHLDFVDDPFDGLFRLEKGVLYPSETPGLGECGKSGL